MYRNKNEKVKPLSWLFSLPVLLFNGSNRRTNIDVNGGFCVITAWWFCTMWRKLADRISRKINEWAVINKNPDILQHSLRRIYNVRWPEMIPNEDLWERAGQEPVAKQILKRKWGWIGHTLRKSASSITRQALTWNPQGKRKRDRPRNSWRRDTEAELKQQGTNWTGAARLAQNRVRWRGVVDGLCSTRSHGP